LAAKEVNMSAKELMRPTITLVATFALTIGFFLDKVPSEAYVPLMAMVIAWWFRSRDEEKRI